MFCIKLIIVSANIIITGKDLIMNHLKICKNCKMHPIKDDILSTGYITYLEDGVQECLWDHPIIETKILSSDFEIWEKISDSTDFYDAMISLHDKDIIEYELKMSQFRAQAEQMNAAENVKKAEENTPKCPMCGSTNITTGQRGYSFWTGFLGSNKTVNRCSNCGHTWKP